MSGALKHWLHDRLTLGWYSKSGLSMILRPLAWIYCALVFLRRNAYRIGVLKSKKFDIPVIIVGNLTVGGTGKTPLVIWLVNYLKRAGYKPGVISRGYSGQAHYWPQQVRPDADPIMVGDEAVVIARQTGCPMAVGPRRIDDCEALIKYANIDVIVSDDGLQHYALQRDVEIVMLDGVRRFGNNHCLPAGPLRERPQRMQYADFIVTNGIPGKGEYAMRFNGQRVVNVISNQSMTLADIKNHDVIAIAGIGNPDRFFNFLRSYGVRLSAHAFPDHHIYNATDLGFAGDKMLLMTEKDAVKCQRFARENWWYLPIEVELDDEFGRRLIDLLESKHG